MRTVFATLLILCFPAAALATDYSTGFESPFVPGPIEPQQGWSASGTNDSWASIAGNPGGQYLLTVMAPQFQPGTSIGAISPALGAQPPGAWTFEIDIHISNTFGADYHVILQAPTQSLKTAEVLFFFADFNGDNIPGDILAFDDLDGPGPAGAGFVASGAHYIPGVSRQLRVEFDPGDGTPYQGSVRYYYGGVLIYTNAHGIWGGSSIEQSVVFHDNFQLPGESARFDNLSIRQVPACATSPGDMDHDGTIDGEDIACFTSCFIDSQAAPCAHGDGCACADMDGDGDLDDCDLCKFTQALLGLSGISCAPAVCP